LNIVLLEFILNISNIQDKDVELRGFFQTIVNSSSQLINSKRFSTIPLLIPKAIRLTPKLNLNIFKILSKILF